VKDGALRDWITQDIITQANQANKRSDKQVQSVRQAKQQANKKLSYKQIEFYLPVKIGVHNSSASISARSGRI
jgi:hypothetical protein